MGIRLDEFHRTPEELPLRPHFSLSAFLKWSDTHVAPVDHVLSQTFAMFHNVGHLFIGASGGHQDNIDNTE